MGKLVYLHIAFSNKKKQTTDASNNMDDSPECCAKWQSLWNILEKVELWGENQVHDYKGPG